MALAGALFGLKLGRRPARKKFLSPKSQERCSFYLEPVISTSESSKAASTSPCPSFLLQSERQVLLMTTVLAILVHFGSQYPVPAFHDHSIAPSIKVFWPSRMLAYEAGNSIQQPFHPSSLYQNQNSTEIDIHGSSCSEALYTSFLSPQ